MRISSSAYGLYYEDVCQCFTAMPTNTGHSGKYQFDFLSTEYVEVNRQYIFTSTTTTIILQVHSIALQSWPVLKPAKT